MEVNGSSSFGGSIFPSLSSSYSCGLSTNRWIAVYALNGTIQTSDSSEKTFEPLQYGLAEIEQIETIKYQWKTKDDPFEYYGCKADQLATIFPELVYNEDPNVPMQLNYSELIPVCINAIKELSEKVKMLTLQVENLLRN